MERYGYGPGGDPIAYNAQGQPQPGGFSSPQLFAGREYDLETGLYYSRLRYYDPQAGRFITRDPLGAWADPTAWGNPYAHCGNSPWDMLDPFGLMVIDPLNDNQAWRNQFSSGRSVRVGDLPSLVPVATRFSHSVNGFFNDPCESAGTKILDGVQSGLDVLGCFFDPLDIVNASLSGVRGDYDALLIRGAASLPVVGIAATASKLAGKGERAAVNALADPMRRFADEASSAGPRLYEEGTFSIWNWAGYPEGLPRPAGPFRLIEGEEYATARKAADAANKAIHAGDASLAGIPIHEIQPVKFGGNPTDLLNKIPLPTPIHKLATTWWAHLAKQVRNY